MSTKDEFKVFVRKNPSLITKVNNGETSWQKLYEIFDLYGEDSDAINTLLNNTREVNKDIKTLFNNLKNMNMDNVKNNINSLKKAVDFLTELTGNNKEEVITNKIFKERPINKIFED